MADRLKCHGRLNQIRQPLERNEQEDTRPSGRRKIIGLYDGSCSSETRYHFPQPAINQRFFRPQRCGIVQDRHAMSRDIA
jgi:hypothetical protein